MLRPRPNHYYDKDTGYSYGPDCAQCEEHETKIACCQDFLIGILEQLYGDHALNVDALENCIDELCGTLGVNFPQKQLNVLRKYREAA